jgi:hypothetical protein
MASFRSKHLPAWSAVFGLFSALLTVHCTELEQRAVVADAGEDSGTVEPDAAVDSGADVGTAPETGAETGTPDAGSQPIDFVCGDRDAWSLASRQNVACGTRRAQEVSKLSKDGLSFRAFALGRSATGRIAMAWSEETGIDVGTSKLRTTSFVPGAAAATGTMFTEPALYASSDFDGPGYDSLAAVGAKDDTVYLAFPETQQGVSNTIFEGSIAASGQLIGVTSFATTVPRHTQVAIARNTINDDRALSWYVRPGASGVDGRILVRIRESGVLGSALSVTGNDTSSADAPTAGAQSLGFDSSGALTVLYGTSALSGSFGRYSKRARGATFATPTTLFGNFNDGTHQGLAPSISIVGTSAVMGAFKIDATGATAGQVKYALYKFDTAASQTTLFPQSPDPTYGTSKYNNFAASGRSRIDAGGLIHMVFGYHGTAGTCRIEYRRQSLLNGTPTWYEDTVHIAPCAADDVPLVDFVIDENRRPHIGYALGTSIGYATIYP